MLTSILVHLFPFVHEPSVVVDQDLVYMVNQMCSQCQTCIEMHEKNNCSQTWKSILKPVSQHRKFDKDVVQYKSCADCIVRFYFIYFTSE